MANKTVKEITDWLRTLEGKRYEPGDGWKALADEIDSKWLNTQVLICRCGDPDCTYEVSLPTKD